MKSPPQPPDKPFVSHVVKTVCLVDKVKQTVNVGLTCDICGEIQLPPIPYDHIAAFARLLEEVHQQLRSPDFSYIPANQGRPITTPNQLNEAIDYHNIISEVLKMSKVKKGQG